MICGRCGQDEDVCGECWQEDDVTIPTNHTLLQGLLRSGVDLDKVVAQYHLHTTRSQRHPQLVQFKYNQIESDLSDPLVRQCRGIIMDSANNWEIVARPFDKFFNFGEPGADGIDWKTARVLEKLDGTCCVLYYYEGWQVATLGSCDASGKVGDHNFTFADLFWNAFQEKGYKNPDLIWDGVTFIFELMTPYNRIVIPHKELDLILLGARLANGCESRVNPESGFEMVSAFALDTLDKVVKSFEGMDPLKQEGYVVVDANYNRIKVKHPGYVRIHQMKDSFTIKNIVNCVRNAEALEFVNYFPEYRDLVNIIKESVFKLCQDCHDVYDITKDIPVQKDFAKQVEDFPYKGILFAVRNRKQPSIEAAVQHMHIDNLVDILETRKAAIV